MAREKFKKILVNVRFSNNEDVIPREHMNGVAIHNQLKTSNEIDHKSKSGIIYEFYLTSWIQLLPMPMSFTKTKFMQK